MLAIIITITIISEIVMLLLDIIGIFSIFKSIFLKLGEINHLEPSDIKSFMKLIRYFIFLFISQYTHMNLITCWLIM